MKVVCEICQEQIATTNKKLLKYPLIGKMFLSPDPFHGYAPPFDASQEWTDMRCPYGTHRPFIEPDRVLTDTGYFFVGDRAKIAQRSGIAHIGVDGDVSSASETQFICNQCGERFDNKVKWASHIRYKHSKTKKVSRGRRKSIQKP